MSSLTQTILDDVAQLMTRLQTPEFVASIDAIGHKLQAASHERKTVFIGGNGGSWADADHFAGELRAQFEVKGRQALPSLAVPISLSTLTAWGNDYEEGFVTAMIRDLEAMATEGDIFIAISTSGKAVNIRRTLAWARDHKLTTIAISGNGPLSQEFGELADYHICIPHAQTARIQEAYQVIIHILCAYIDKI